MRGQLEPGRVGADRDTFSTLCVYERGQGRVRHVLDDRKGEEGWTRCDARKRGTDQGSSNATGASSCLALPLRAELVDWKGRVADMAVRWGREGGAQTRARGPECSSGHYSSQQQADERSLVSPRRLWRTPACHTQTVTYTGARQPLLPTDPLEPQLFPPLPLLNPPTGPLSPPTVERRRPAFSASARCPRGTLSSGSPTR